MGTFPSNSSMLIKNLQIPDFFRELLPKIYTLSIISLSLIGYPKKQTRGLKDLKGLANRSTVIKISHQINLMSISVLQIQACDKLKHNDVKSKENTIQI